jgi:hypothetical protein
LTDFFSCKTDLKGSTQFIGFHGLLQTNFPATKFSTFSATNASCCTQESLAKNNNTQRQSLLSSTPLSQKGIQIQLSPNPRVLGTWIDPTRKVLERMMMDDNPVKNLSYFPTSYGRA